MGSVPVQNPLFLCIWQFFFFLVHFYLFLILYFVHIHRRKAKKKKKSSELYNIVIIIQKDLFLIFFSFIKSLKVSLRSCWLAGRDVKERDLSVYEEGKRVSSTAPSQIQIHI